MQALQNYIHGCYSPKDDSEFCVEENYSLEAFTRLRADGLMVCYDRPSEFPFEMEAVSIGENGWIIRKAPKTVSWYDEHSQNTNFDVSQDPLWHRLVPTDPTNSETVDHVSIIGWVLEEYKKQLQKLGQSNPICYIEYGVRYGTCLKEIMQVADVSIGVDMSKMPEFNSPKVITVQMLTTEFSAEVLPFLKPNAIFIDADHKRESVFGDFEDVFPHIAVGGYIFLHDSHPCEEWLLHPGLCNDCYRANIDIKKRYKSRI